MAQRHLNITREEAARVIVDFEINKFVAYVELASGTPIVFDTAYEYVELQHSSEFSKYMNEWDLPLTLSKMALQKAW